MYLQHRRSWLWNTAAANMRIDARRLRPSKTSRRVNAGSTVRLEEMRCWATPSAMHWICMVFPSLAPQWLWGGSAWPNFRSAPRLTMDRVRGLHRVWGLDSMSPFRDLPLPRLPLVSVRCLAQGQGHGVLERRPSRLAPARLNFLISTKYLRGVSRRGRGGSRRGRGGSRRCRGGSLRGRAFSRRVRGGSRRGREGSAAAA